MKTTVSLCLASHILFVRIKPELFYQLASAKPNQALNVYCSVNALSCPTGAECSNVLPSPSSCLLYQFEALCVEAVPLPARHGLQQSLLLLGAARRLQLIHSG